MVNRNPSWMVKWNSHFEAAAVGYKKLYRSRNDTRKNVQKDSKLQATSIGEFIEKYNAQRLHQSLKEYDTPLEAYLQMKLAVA